MVGGGAVFVIVYRVVVHILFLVVILRHSIYYSFFFLAALQWALERRCAGRLAVLISAVVSATLYSVSSIRFNCESIRASDCMRVRFSFSTL
eukprot:SAG11_NODE_8575_length_997_cov_1.330000_1_plen_92_part_00